MSIQWTFIAGYLYMEIGIVLILMLPIASPRKWRKFFRSRLFYMFQQHAAMYFFVLQGLLGLFLIDAVREMRKYSNQDSSHGHLATEMKGNVKLFRAQRNFYITGFAIFLAFVIRRLVSMIIIQAELLEKSEMIIKEAEAAKDLAKTTVLSHKIQVGDTLTLEEIKNQLEIAEGLLIEEKIRAKEFEDEAIKWRSKFDELSVSITGKGDEL